MTRLARSIGYVALAAWLAACSNGRGSLDDQPAPPPSGGATDGFTIGGSVTGLTASGLVLRNNGGGDLPVNADGPFTFAGNVSTGAAYNVTIATQPTAQTCTVANGTGTVAEANVTDITVACSNAPRFTIGGNVAGLTGSGLVLQNNGGDDLPIAANGPFAFATTITNEGAYSVTVRTQPPGQNCVVQNASGNVANANVSDIAVSCATNQFTVGGGASGLEGAGLVLKLNGGSDLKVVGNGPFAFPSALLNGTAYTVTIAAQPSNPTQVCTLSNPSGTIAGANVTNVGVQCATSSFTVGGTVSGVAGPGLVLRLNGASDLAIQSNGSFTFPTPLLSGTSYNVSVVANPQTPLQICTVTRATGIVRGTNVANVAVSCATQTFSVGGTVSGLLGSGLVLVINGADPVEVESDGAFVFPKELASGATYNVSVKTPPSNPTQACSIANGTGSVSTLDISNISITCTTSSFTVGGNVANLSGTGLILRNNGGDDLPVDAPGPFTFPTAIPSATGYAVTVAQQPTSPEQECTVTNGSGVVGGSAVTNVGVQCVTKGFPVGGEVVGLLGGSVVIQNNGGAPMAIGANGPFQFPAPVLSGQPYNVTVFLNPPLQVCSVENGSGSVTNAAISTVIVRCARLGFL